MAYQNTGTPRFYVNAIEWLLSNGVNVVNSAEGTVWNPSVWNTLPVDPTNYYTNWYLTTHQPDLVNIPNGVLGNQSFWAILGHNIQPDGYGQHIRLNDATTISTSEIINFSAPPDYKGFSIATCDFTGEEHLFMMASGNIGSMIVGTYYDMPHSPELSLTMTRESNINRVRTKGGSDLVSQSYHRPMVWGNAAPWELYEGMPVNQAFSGSGRRIWDLSFSYLQDSDVFGSNQSLGIPISSGATDAFAPMYTSEGYDDGDKSLGHFNYNLLTDDNFFSQVIHKTNGGQLPFIFQPNKDDITNFAICKFVQNSFQFEQVANGIYNMSLKIREVW